MRLYRTYILRLLVDTQPEQLAPELHGSLQAIGEEQSHPFKSGEALLAQLQDMLLRPSNGNQSSQPSPQENEQ